MSLHIRSELSEEDFARQYKLCSFLGISAGTAIAGSGALSGLSSLVGSGKSSSASKSAASESLQATEAAIQAEEQMYGQTETNLWPYNSYGQSALGGMASIAGATPSANWYMPSANAAMGTAGSYQGLAGQYLQQASGMNPLQTLTEQGLQNTPGYQFELGQGLKATQAAAAARGLGVSGASLKGAATYATGLADANYQTQFNAAQTGWQDVMNQAATAQNLGQLGINTASGYLGEASTAQQAQQQQYSQYANLANLGENAAAQTGQAGTSTSGQIASSLSSGSQQYGNYLSQSGQAQAAGISGVGNAATSGVNNYLAYSALSNLGTFGGSTAGAVDTGVWSG